MIERFYLKNYLSFQDVELNLSSGLVVFTGPSGSGKSVLMNSILTSLGLASCDASVCESSVTWDIDGEDIGIENEDLNVFRHVKKEKSRFFVNNQSISKKAIARLASKHIRHLSLKDFSDFENKSLLYIIDKRVEKYNKEIIDIKSSYKDSFFKYKEIKKELKKIEDEEKKIVELKEFAAFEIKKIDDIAP
ncbi:MAG: AAA family ATPase, partial [Campylobacterales bacterium]|nr:AAA family ATPase [Campylobacterales bacterium]